MPTTSETFTDLYVPGLRNIIFESYTYLPTEWSMFLRAGSSERQYEEDYRMAGFGAVPTKAEGANIIYDDPVPDGKIRYEWTPYGKGFRVTHEAMMDDLYGPMKRMASSLGKAFRNQDEIIGAAILNNAFTAPAAGANNSGYDGLALCHTAHTTQRGGTFTNRAAVEGALTVAALEASFIDFENLIDESGVPIVMPPRRLLVTPTQVADASRILKSTLEPTLGAGGADVGMNDINIFNNALDLIVSHYLTAVEPWFVLAAPDDTDIWMITREEFMTDAADDFDSGDGKIKGYMRKAAGFGDARGVWGNDGVV